MKYVHVIVGAGVWQQDGLRYRRHRLAEFLAGREDTEQVFWICPSPHRKDDCRVGENGVIEQWSVTDVLPQKVFRFSRYLSVFHHRRLAELAQKIQPYIGKANVCLWYTFPGFADLIELLPWERVIYDRSDLWAAPISGKKSLAADMRRRLIAGSEQKILQAADQIFCTSDYLRQITEEQLPTEKHSRIMTLENGVDYDLFASADGSSEPDAKQTVLGYIGGIKPKLDFALLRGVAMRKPEWQILLIGPDGTNGDPDFERLLHCPNVRWKDAVPPEEVPLYMQQITIGVMPYKFSPYNNAVFPLKLFEFLASGKAAVGIQLPSTKKYETESAYVCLDRSDPELLVAACERLEKEASFPEAVQRRRQLAKSRDWPVIFEQMLQQI